MRGKSSKSNPYSVHKSFKISAALALVTVGMIGVTTETPQTILTRDQNTEISLTKSEKVTIHRYEMTDYTTGSTIFVSKIKNQ